MVLMYWWARQYPVTDAAQEAKVENTAVQAYHAVFQGHLQLAVPKP